MPSLSGETFALPPSWITQAALRTAGMTAARAASPWLGWKMAPRSAGGMPGNAWSHNPRASTDAIR